MALTRYYGSAPGAPADYNSIVKGYSNALDQQNATSNALQLGYQGMQKQVNLLGDAQKYDLQRQNLQQLAGSEQSMVDRGLYNSTIYDTAQRGINYDYGNQKTQLMDTLNRERLGVTQAGLNQAAESGKEYQGILAGLSGFQGTSYGQQQDLEGRSYLAAQQQQYNQANLGLQHAYGMSQLGAQQNYQQVAASNQRLSMGNGIGSQPGGGYGSNGAGYGPAGMQWAVAGNGGGNYGGGGDYGYGDGGGGGSYG